MKPSICDRSSRELQTHGRVGLSGLRHYQQMGGDRHLLVIRECVALQRTRFTSGVAEVVDEIATQILVSVLPRASMYC